jgi:hypothetical protein
MDNTAEIVKVISEVGCFGLSEDKSWKYGHWVTTSGSTTPHEDYSAGFLNSDVGEMISNAVIITDIILLDLLAV